MAYRDRWVDVHPDWVEWLEARVEALVDENKRLQTLLDEKRDEKDQAVLGLLVHRVPVQAQVSGKAQAVPPPFPKHLQEKFARHNRLGLVSSGHSAIGSRGRDQEATS
jgi:hypothetical protein